MGTILHPFFFNYLNRKISLTVSVQTDRHMQKADFSFFLILNNFGKLLYLERAVNI